MKKKILMFSFLVVSLLSSCAGGGGLKNSQNNSPLAANNTEDNSADTTIKDFLSKARKGFVFKTTSNQRVFDKTTNKELFVNQTNYEYTFDDSNGSRVSQKVSVVGGSTGPVELNVVRDENGYVAREYINYKNEVDLSRLVDENYYYVRYDESFINPFLLLEESDFVPSETESSVYLLSDSKINIFEYFLESRGLPMEEIKFVFEGNELKQMVSKTISREGKALNSETKTYSEAYWYYEDVATLTELGTAKIESIKPSEASDAKNEVEEILGKVNDNFTLRMSIIADGEVVDETTDKISYFDGTNYYIDYEVGDESKDQDSYYQLDGDKYTLYSYNSEYDVFMEALNTSSTSFNIDPKDKSYFVPHLSEISGDLFRKRGENYIVNNQNAAPFIGSGFLSDLENIPYFTLGYGHDASFTYDETSETITVTLPFYVAISGYYFDMGYKLTYSNIGTTKLPEVAL